MLMKRPLLLVFIFVLLAGLIVACGGASGETAAPDELETIRLPMGYIADPQYAPFYVAVEKGYYADEGLAIEFDYSFETDGIALVGANELPLAIVSGDQVLLARAEGLPVVYVMEWFETFPVAVVSKAEAGIRTPADLAGRNVGLPGFFGASYVGLVGLLAAADMTLDDIDANDIGFNQVESLITDQSEAVVVYINNEPLQLEAQGVELNVIPVGDYSDMVANGIISNEETIANNPELIESFVRATLRGLSDTLTDPNGAFEITKGFVEGLEDGRKSVLEASLPLWESENPGVTELPSWEETQQVLLGMGFLDAPLTDLEATFTNDFVLAIQNE